MLSKEQDEQQNFAAPFAGWKSVPHQTQILVVDCRSFCPHSFEQVLTVLLEGKKGVPQHAHGFNCRRVPFAIAKACVEHFGLQY